MTEQKIRKAKRYEIDTKEYVECKLYPDYRINYKKGQIINSENLILGAPNNHGYLVVTLFDSRNKKSTTMSIHRLIYREAYPEDEIKAGFDIDHINAIRSDNRLENLQKITHKSNVKKSAKKRDYSFVKNNHKPGHRKRVLETNLKTGKKVLFGSLYQAAKKRGANAGSIKYCCDGVTKEVTAKTNNKTYKYKCISEQKYHELKEKYECYARPLTH